MIGELFLSCHPTRPQRPTFRPVLESLESREVPTAAQISAAFHALPNNVAALNANLNIANTPVVQFQIAQVTNDIFLLKTGAPGFVEGDRLRIDSALFTNGLQLIFDGFNAFPRNSEATSITVIQLGIDAVRSGGIDFVITGFFPQTSGSSVLT
jgi:hypothetical protein